MKFPVCPVMEPVPTRQDPTFRIFVLDEYGRDFEREER